MRGFLIAITAMSAVSTVLLTSGCATDTEGAQTQALNAAGDYRGIEVFQQTLADGATGASVSPFNYIKARSADSEGQITSAYSRLAMIVGPTTLTGVTTTHLVRLPVAVLASPADTWLTNITTVNVEKLYFGTTHGGGSTLPAGCITSVDSGVHTLQMFRGEDRSFATEVARKQFNVPETGAFDFCAGVIRVFLNNGAIDADKKLANGTTQSATASLGSTCNGLTTVDDCLDALAGVAGNIAIAPILSPASAKLLTVNSTSATLANIRSGSYTFQKFGDAVVKTSITDTAMANTLNWILGVGAATAEADAVSAGAVQCDVSTPFNC